MGHLLDKRLRCLFERGDLLGHLHGIEPTATATAPAVLGFCNNIKTPLKMMLHWQVRKELKLFFN